MDVREEGGHRMGRVDFGGVARSVCLELVDAVPGDWVLVHVGFALTKLSPDDAADLLSMLEELCLPDDDEVSDEQASDDHDQPVDPPEVAC